MYYKISSGNTGIRSYIEFPQNTVFLSVDKERLPRKNVLKHLFCNETTA